VQTVCSIYVEEVMISLKGGTLSQDPYQKNNVNLSML
jgi:hypothetical protein